MSETTIPTIVQNRVAAGAAYLDTEHPGWFREVSTNRLDIRDGCLCVLGQLHGDFDNYLDDYDLSLYTALDYGFYLEDSDDPLYADLKNEWIRVIEERRENEQKQIRQEVGA